MNLARQGESVPAVRDVQEGNDMAFGLLRSAANFGKNALGAFNGASTTLGGAVANAGQAAVNSRVTNWATQQTGRDTRKTVAIGAAEQTATNVAKTFANAAIAQSKWIAKMSNDVVQDMH